MTDQEKQIFVESLIDTAKLAEDTVYESLSLLFETTAKQIKEKLRGKKK